MTFEELEKKLNHRQRKFVHHLLDGLSQTEAAIAAGYSVKSAASQASELVRKPVIIAYRKAYAQAVYERMGLTPETIALKLLDILDRCMQATPVLKWDPKLREWAESGVWQFDARNATRVLELLGKNAGMFTERVSVSGTIGSLEELLSQAPSVK